MKTASAVACKNRLDMPISLSIFWQKRQENFNYAIFLKPVKFVREEIGILKYWKRKF